MKDCKNCMHYRTCLNERIRAVMNIGAEFCSEYMSGWVNVKEHLPNKDENVLCYRGNHICGMKDVYRYMGDDSWEDSYGYWNRTEDEGITHWMELPPDPTT